MLACCKAAVALLTATHAVKAAAPGQAPAAMPYRNFGHAVKQIARHEGLAGFYRGLGPSLIMVGLLRNTVHRAS